MRCASLLMLLLTTPLHVLAAEPQQATPAVEWDAVFDRQEGWVGGDAIYSTPLSDGDVLWLFADTFLGKVENGRRQGGLRMVNNTLARCKLPVPGQAPDPSSLQFLWGRWPDLKEPAAWIAPDGRSAALNGGGKRADAKPAEWYWVADAVVAKGPEARDRLVVFLWRMTRNKEGGAFGFRGVGCNLAVIDDPAADWKTWKPRQSTIPHAVPNSIDDPRRKPSVAWGSEVFSDPQSADAALLIFGYRTPENGINQLVAARAPADAVETMDQWRFRTKDGWSEKLDDAAALAEGVTTEFSITPVEKDGARLWVLIQSEPFLGDRIQARTARSPFGPWSKSTPIYRVPGLSKEKKHFTYAAKAHPELSREGELLVSYVVNSMDFSEAVGNAAIYRPRFLRVPVSLLPASPE